jgi:hypothetical protein
VVQEYVDDRVGMLQAVNIEEGHYKFYSIGEERQKAVETMEEHIRV